MSYAVSVPEDYVWLMGRFVAEGQTIVPGAPLMDIMTPDGVVETIRSEGWGIVAHVEGHRVFANGNEREDGDDEDDSDDGEAGSRRSSSGGMGVVFSKGHKLCHIVARDGWEAGTIRGLTPRPTTVIAKRRARGLNLSY